MQIKHHDYERFQLWETNIGGVDDQSLANTHSYLSLGEKQHFETIKNKHRKSEFLASRALLRHALSDLFQKPLPFWEIDYTPHSLPVVHNLPKPTLFSLSHSHGRINFVTSKHYEPIGVDVEKRIIRKNIIQTSEMFMSIDELQAFELLDGNDKTNFFYKIWCAKEAYFKLLSPALQNSFTATSLSIMALMQHHSEYEFFDLGDNLYSRVVLISTCIAAKGY